MISTEGGIHHIAAAVGTPAVVICGGFIRPEWTGYDGQVAVTNRMDCSDACYNTNPCGRGDLACWRNITAPEVIEAGLKLQEVRREHIGVSE